MAGSERSQAVLSTEELHELLDSTATVIVSTIGRNCQPHMVALWALRDGDNILAWTYGTSQKVQNIRRDPRATLLMETGVSYQELRGVSMDCDVELIDDLEQKMRIGLRIHGKFSGMTPGEAEEGEIPEPIKKQAGKRIVLLFKPRRIRTWDHRKLSKSY